MKSPLFLAALTLASVAGAEKKIVPAKAGNDTVDVIGTALITRDQVKSELGVDPGMDVVAVKVTVKPKGESGVAISRDDFTLIARNDGQKSQAMHPSQIAGSGVMVVSSRAPGAAGGFGTPSRGPIWGGMPGTGTRPRRVGGDQDIPAGIADGETRATITDTQDMENPLLAALKQKELVQSKITEPTSGLLYFVLEGKHKLKDLELLYKTPEGTLDLDFQK